MAKRKNHFLSFMRQGLTTLTDHAGPVRKRMVLPVKVDIAAKGQSTQKAVIRKEINLFGPGDILGIQSSTVSRVSPPANTTEFEPNLTPFIEFTEPDFLWRFSTRMTTDKKNWIPWLSLILLKREDGEQEGEFVTLKNSDKNLPPKIQLNLNAVLPDLREQWRWAHVHSQGLNGNLEQIKTSLISKPHKSVSRLLSPRSLKAQTKYQAFLVPTYRIGADAALGISNGIENMRTLTWETPAKGVGTILPYFYSWSFQTGTKGDFEYLVRQLTPRDLDNMGTRAIDCSKPGYGINTQNLTLQMEAALKSLDTKYQKWGMDDTETDGLANPVQKALAEILNKRQQTKNGTTTLRVTPPIYGKWYAANEDENLKVNPENTRHWIEELNLDFRHRAAAGLGVRFVKEHQEELMKAAWQQLSKVRKVNNKLNMGRFGRELSMNMYKRLKNIQTQTLVTLALPLQDKMSLDQTIKGKNISKSESALKTKSSTLPNTKETLRSLFQKNDIAYHLTQIKTKKYLPRKVNAKKTDSNSFALIAAAQILSPGFKPDGTPESATSKVKIVRQNLKPTSSLFKNFGLKISKILNPKYTIEDKLIDQIDDFRKIEKWKQPTSTEQASDPLRPIMWYPEFHRPLYSFLRSLSQEYILPGIEKIPQNTVGLLQTNRRFIEAFMVGCNHEFAAELRWREFPTDMHGSFFRSFWDTSIYSLNEQEKIQFRSTGFAKKLLAQIKADYNTPQLKSDWPKIEAVYAKGTPNTIERQIADAYEISIEKWLLTREADKDINNPSDWILNSRLGDHPVSGKWNNKEEDQNQIVVLIRGELLQKFGNTLIYLVEKKSGNQTKPAMTKDAIRIFPIFEAAMPPDMTFIGFPISQEKVADFYIIFEERITSLRFGLDITADGTGEEDLSWVHFNKLPAEGYLDKHQPDLLSEKWNNASYIAKVMLQKQVRVAVPLEQLIPK